MTLKLTDLQQKAYELRMSSDPKPTWDEIAKKMGVTKDVARKHYRSACHKVGFPTEATSRGKPPKDPKRHAKFMEKLADPLSGGTVMKAAEESGMDPTTARHVSRHMQTANVAAFMEVERIQNEALVRGFEQLAHRSLESITDEDLQKMNAYQRTLIAAISTDKRELLDGRPTDRISVEERREMPQIIEALMTEAKRRGLMPEYDQRTQTTRLSTVDPEEERQYQLTKRSDRDRVIDVKAKR